MQLCRSFADTQVFHRITGDVFMMVGGRVSQTGKGIVTCDVSCWSSSGKEFTGKNPACYLVSARKLPVLKVAGDFGIFLRALLSNRRVFAAR